MRGACLLWSPRLACSFNPPASWPACSVLGPPMSSIFVSYRRTDAPAHAGRIYDRLVDRFGKDNVYKDLDSTAPGADFAEVIKETIATCDAVLAVIGRDWVSATRRWRRRRLNDSKDWVEREIAVALERNIGVVPVLVDGARMPSPDELPKDVKVLAQRHAVELSETAWTPQLTQLIDSLATPSPYRDARDRLVDRPGSKPRSELPALEPGFSADVPALDPARPPVV